MRIGRLGIDPGETTGIAYAIEEEIIWSKEVPNGLEGFIHWWKHDRWDDPDEVIIENFVVEPDFVGVPVASEIIGALHVLYRGKIVRQQRSDKSSLYNQKKKGEAGEAERFEWLEQRGFSRIGKGHNLDAVTHVLIRLKRLRHMGAWKRYWT